MEDELVREEGTGYEKKKHGAGAAGFIARGRIDLRPDTERF